MLIHISKGLDIPITGEPEQVISDGSQTRNVALIGDDYHDIKPGLLVEEGQQVRTGQGLFNDKKTGIPFTAPSCGVIRQINHGMRRTLRSIVIEVNGDEAETFPDFSEQQIQQLSPDEIKKILISSGSWTAFRTRPYNRIPDPQTIPHSLFVTAIDTNPLSADPGVIIHEYERDFVNGLTVLSRLFTVPIFLCREAQLVLPEPELGTLRTVGFSGPHPAGLVGTHVHFLDPVNEHKTVWHVGYQDVIAMGKLFTEGKLWTQRIIALAGPQITNPGLLRVQCGVDLKELLRDELKPGNHRIISGPVLSGRNAINEVAYLGRYHQQVSVIEEASRGHSKSLTSRDKPFSLHHFLNRVRASRSCFTSAMHGPGRVMFPVGDFERVMPLDLLPTPLLKALLSNDIENAAALGCLELDEEDLALCTFVCCSKQDYGLALRTCLAQIEKESE